MAFHFPVLLNAEMLACKRQRLIIFTVGLLKFGGHILYVTICQNKVHCAGEISNTCANALVLVSAHFVYLCKFE